MGTASFTTVAKQEGGEEIMDPWLFIDTIAKGIAAQPSGDGITQLQRVVAEALCLPPSAVQRSWVSINLIEATVATFPGEMRRSTQDVIASELDRVELELAQEERTLGRCRIVVLVDEIDAAPSVIGKAVALLGTRARREPDMMGLRQDERLRCWHIVNSTVAQPLPPTADGL